MKQLFFSIVLICSAIAAPAQRIGTIAGQATHFQLHHQRDTIDFIVADTSLAVRKPVLLFCQGSLPVPLFVRLREHGVYMLGGGINNFNLADITLHYHLVVLSMPATPVVAAEGQLDASYCYIPDSTQPRLFAPAYVEGDYLDNYVRRAGQVLRFLRRQDWVDSGRLVVAGHSQGAKVAAKLAGRHKRITHLGLFAANPFGRIDQLVRQARKDAESGKIDWETADAQMEQYYRFYETVQQPDSLAQQPELKAWKTFSEPFLDDWLQLDIPVYLAYGTADPAAALCDIVPLFFIREGKQNLTLKRYLRQEHNFFEVTDNGKTNYENAHWPEVMHAFLEWTLRTGSGR